MKTMMLITALVITASVEAWANEHYPTFKECVDNNESWEECKHLPLISGAETSSSVNPFSSIFSDESIGGAGLFSPSAVERFQQRLDQTRTR